VEIKVNGETRNVASGSVTPLADVLRDELHLTGTKVACGEGFCGSCMVLVDDQPMVSCLLPVGTLADRAVRTIESFAPAESPLTPLQQALKDNDAVQCGMCFPGMVISLSAMLENNASPNDDDVRTALVGNICRCTGYERIVEAALEVSGATNQKEQA
jgi:aerobic carbon-monoxide dehydrogenase small subunit